MKRAVKWWLTVWMLAGGLVMFSGCGKDAPPPPPPPRPTTTEPDKPPAPTPTAPTIRISASPSSIERNSQTTLRWDSTDANSVVIDNGVGNVATSGSLVITPLDSVTYTATATGAGGDAKASTRITVIRPAPTAPLTTDQTQIEDLIDRGDFAPIFFAYDKSDLSDESRATLRKNAEYLRAYPESRVLIEGHCDERGSEEYNLALGDRRAQAAYDFLTQAGVAAEQLRTISYGEERPFNPDKTEKAFAENRRAHFRGSR